MSDGKHSYRAGSIKSIKLVNFMCHESFEQSFGPRVNFVIGRNGSGKSAILTAIVVALGGRATTTSRAKRVNEFVMYGKRQAKIQLILHNYDKVMDKPQAFKPDDYGKTITVERVIYKDEAVSKLALRSEKDKIVSERRQELDEMMEHFGILINNPICVLNQEVSKSFLHSKKAEDKFDLFMKATTLEQIEQDYQIAQKTHKDWDDCNSTKNIAFRLLDAEYESCKEKTGFLENRVRLNSTQQALVQEKLWAIYRDNEVLSESLKSKLQDINKTIQEAQHIVDSRSEKIKNYDEDIQIARTKIQSILRQSEETRKKFQDIREKEANVKRRKIDYKNSIEQANKRIQRFSSDNLSLGKSISELRTSLEDQNALDKENELRKMELERLEREVPADNAKEKSLRLQIDQLNNSMTSIRSEITNANMRVNTINGKLSQNNALERRLKNGQENTIRRYGDGVMRALREIDEAHSKHVFRKKPIGPLGYHLKLKSPEIAQVLEIHLGRTAHAFLCDNKEDMTKLTAIFKKIAMNSHDFRHPLILTRPFRDRHNISQHRAQHDTYKTLLDYLEIESSEVYNAVVDRNNLECVLFIPNYTEAEALLINEAMVPKNTRCAYTKDCSVMHPKTLSGGYKSFTNNGSRCMLFSESNQNQIMEIQREIRNCQADLADAEKIVRGLQDSLRNQREEYEQNNKEIRRLREEIRKKEDRLLSIKAIVNVAPQELSALEEEFSSNLVKIAKEKLEIEKYQEILNSLDMELADIMKEKDECSKLLKKHEENHVEQRKILDQTKESVSKFHEQVKEKKLVIENRKIAKTEATTRLDVALEALARSQQAISPEFEKPRVIRKTEEIVEEMRKIEAQIRIEQEEMRDPDELMASLRKRMKEIENLVSLKDMNLSNYNISQKSLKSRSEGFRTLREQIVSELCSMFTTIMKTMKMTGELQINMEDVVHRGEIVKKARTLEMRIDTSHTPSQRTNLLQSDNNNNDGDSIDNRRTSRSQPVGAPRPKRARLDLSVMQAHDKENEVKLTDARSLSGGERSFSTVAFVLSLWRFCNSPFKLMDEIDVFMDMVTRRVSYGYLIRFAQGAEVPGQYIFFSPLELPKLEDSGSFVNVFEMPVIVRREHPPGSSLMLAGCSEPASL